MTILEIIKKALKGNAISDEDAAKIIKDVEAEKADTIKDEEKEEEKKVELPGISPELKAMFEAQAKQILDLTGLVASSVKSVASAEKVASAKLQIIAEKLPEAWAGRVNVESETSIEDQVKVLKEEFTAIQQGIINDAVASGAYAPGSTQMKERSEEEWTKLMNEETKTGNPGVVDLGIK